MYEYFIQGRLTECAYQVQARASTKLKITLLISVFVLWSFGGSQNRLTNADSLVTEKYEAYLEQMIRAAGAVNETELQMCLSDPSHVFNISILVK